MLTQHAVFVDAGYLLSQAVAIASGGASRQRKDLDIADLPGLLAFLKEAAARFSPRSRLLRIYWYDGVATSMTPEQATIAAQPDLHFRGGSLHNGKQKGVDSRIVQDLFELASERTLCDALIVTGDGDLSVGIEFAQRRGVRVAILGVEDLAHGVAPDRHVELSQLADRVLTMDATEIGRFFGYTPTPSAMVAPADPAPPAALSGPVSYEQIVEATIVAIRPEHRHDTLNPAGGILQDVDRQLLLESRRLLGRNLEDDERSALRAVYRARVRQA